MRIFIDTNILIDYSKGYETILRNLLTQKKADIELCVNPIVLTEFFSDRNLRKKSLQSQAKEFIRLFEHLDITSDIGILAGSFISQGLCEYLGDSIIAATCIREKCLLCTRNTKDFANIPELQFYSQEESST